MVSAMMKKMNGNNMKKINEVTTLSLTNKEKVDSVLSFVFLKKLIKPIQKTDAHKLGLVDNNGKIIKEPESDEELRALSQFDKVVFKIKRLLGSRVAQLNAFIYLQSLDDDFYDQMIITGALSKKAAIQRMNRDIEAVVEKHGFDLETGLQFLIAEECRKKKIEKE